VGVGIQGVAREPDVALLCVCVFIVSWQCAGTNQARIVDDNRAQGSTSPER